MATIDSLNKSILEMTDEEATDLIMKIRANRRRRPSKQTRKKKSTARSRRTAASKKKPTQKDAFQIMQSMNPEQRKLLEKQLLKIMEKK